MKERYLSVLLALLQDVHSWSWNEQAVILVMDRIDALIARYEPPPSRVGGRSVGAEFHCGRCGEPGHYRPTCEAPHPLDRRKRA